MQQETTGVQTAVVLRSIPLRPEDNPPDDIDELSALIDLLEEKATTIKLSINREMLLEPDNRNMSWLTRASCAKTKTYRSIGALQRLLKSKKEALKSSRTHNFHMVFFDTAKQVLEPKIFTHLVDEAQLKVAA